MAVYHRGKDYTYRGDKLTDPELKGKECHGMLNQKFKCIRGKNGNMLVWFPEAQRHVVVLARQLRICK
jgi:hypothetical protein